MKLIKDKFKYPDLQRVENELGRFYIDSKVKKFPQLLMFYPQHLINLVLMNGKEE